MQIKRALVSVSDKTHLDILANWFLKEGVEVISSGGTGAALQELGVKVTPIQEVTGNPEAFGGRMKTLSFEVSSGLLFRRGHVEDEKQAQELGIKPIDLVVCNLYPFLETAKKTTDLHKLIENIDIGGPTMIRAAAKNFAAVTVLTNPQQYQEFVNLEANGEMDLCRRKKFSLSAFRHTASYDSIIADILGDVYDEPAPFINLNPENASELRYGENPHQKGHVYSNFKETGLANIKPLQGKALSYNNYLDADAAWRSLSDMMSLNNASYPYMVSIVKHSNPCGVACSTSSLRALEMAWEGDPVSSFGSIICFGQEVGADCADFLNKRFVEVIIAPSFSADARELFSIKKNLRLIELAPHNGEFKAPMVRSISGGWVVQQEDCGMDPELRSVTKNAFPSELGELSKFGVFASKHLRSNAIALVAQSDDGLSLVGAGMGNPNRLISLEQSVNKAHQNGIKDLSSAILISDAFFPFKDNIEIANEHGIKNIIQPGGSIKDEEVIKACDEFGIRMAFTGRRHFRH